MRDLRIAIVGAGLMGRWHARYAKRTGSTVTAIVDSNLQSAASLRSQGFRTAVAFDDFDTCLSTNSFEIVHICTGTHSHATLAEKAILANKHVLVEKPVATSVERTQHLIKLANERGVRFCAVHQFPFQRGFRAVLRNIDRLGDLVQVSHIISSAGGDGCDRRRRHEILREMLPHGVSLLERLFLNGVDISAWTALQDTADELSLSACFDGVQLDLTYSLRARPTRNELHLVGTRATARIDLFHGYGVWQRGSVSRTSKILQPFCLAINLFSGAALNLAIRFALQQPAYPGLPELIRDFYRSVLQKQPAPVGHGEMVDAASMMELVNAAQSNQAQILAEKPSP